MSQHIDPKQQCQHISPRGQRCRMLRASEAELFCLHHLRKAASSQLDPEALAAETRPGNETSSSLGRRHTA